VNVHVVRASDGCFLWSDRFDREAHDSFGTQAEIAEEVASGCGTSILGLPDGMEQGTWASLSGAA
jgi:TolB-like protein